MLKGFIYLVCRTGAVCFFFAALLSNSLYAADDMKWTLQQFSFEVPNKDGSRCALIEGDNASVITGGLIGVQSIRAKIFTEDGREVLVLSERGFFDKNKKEVTSDVMVKVVSKDIVMTGTGMVWNPNNRLIEIKEDVRLEFIAKKNVEGAKK